MKKYYPLFLLAILVSCQGISQEKKSPKKEYTVVKTDAEWKEILSPLAYDVLRHAATERPFSGPLNDNKKKGIYVCGGCQAPLYESQYKFDSGSGWPSFDRGFEENLEYDVDYKIGYPRSELKCNKCGGHLGHMFNDGPRKTTGQRHCINSAALAFIPTNE
ncbi:MAG: peptide-methionine (R)-S-oxide reductase MsrB [Flavobacteriaceae bacterium]|jgi:peptide-methionine (R)-S-oxide reductase|nr:peptide-methionine (R)-S-oxide reductase MsrB [Flavobacteriaceae bacterium]MBT4313292.1 peptide-methionine (R)-S-oxide reductase MsrB [Flavobacteriaceae bacterium]MBT5091303.1 peptide-methionine (R)-S-oxide reductase MsrB [Flavobacteriaceae bacterium]MBT5284160.1 peptide-methionine (R)-S-oxide reductase MsrB [Flavobacteriaceae bacterium]MBT5445816.1 peptide-methionine (R)-S-oxide reductase MsrB [Flavobacteriaceae bacterium]